MERSRYMDKRTAVENGNTFLIAFFLVVRLMLGISTNNFIFFLRLFISEVDKIQPDFTAGFSGL